MTGGRKTRSNDVFTQRMKQFLDVWMEGDAWLKDALASMQITSYMQLVDLLKDPNTVNSIDIERKEGKKGKKEKKQLLITPFIIICTPHSTHVLGWGVGLISS
jgi:hypothetical protein